MSDLVVVIPARGGSQRIKGKNIRPLAGKPLVHHAIEYAFELEPKMKIVVSTDSDEVAGVVRTRYPDVIVDASFQHTDTTTVDDVTKWYYEKLVAYTNLTLVVIQPTMIGDVVDNAKDMLAYISQGDSGGWIRLSGLRVAKGLFAHWGQMRPVDDTTLIDIDTMADFAAAETYLRKQTTIGIYYKAGEKVGWGHQKRAETLADALQDYDVECMDIYEHGTIRDPIFKYRNVQILDVGDTPEKLVSWRIRGSKVITIEDNGPGARLAHASINPFNDLKYAVLRPEFYNLPEYVVRDEVRNILLTSGGQNNHKMIEHQLNAIKHQNPEIVSLVSRPQPGHMAAQMLNADILICAGGQTSYEAIRVGVPTIVIPSLPTEAMRPHLSPGNGFINLGMVPSGVTFWTALVRMMKDKMLRQDMSNRMKATRVGDGALEIRRIIEDLCHR
jgi:spore coat polysaccharide biosynthesis predicted glycosyltransferase SpsG/GTP:adenosylcobinamide-phosphate guanylyltransferase